MSSQENKHWWCCNAEYGKHEPTCKNYEKQKNKPCPFCGCAYFEIVTGTEDRDGVTQ